MKKRDGDDAFKPGRAPRVGGRPVRPLAGIGVFTLVALELGGVVSDVTIDGVTAATDTGSYTAPPPQSAGGNRAPTLKLSFSSNAPKNRAKQTVDEGETVTIKVKAADANGDAVYLSASNLPPGAQWSPGANGGKQASGLFTWTPAPGTARALPVTAVTFAAVDVPANGRDSLSTSQSITLNVGKNSPPQLDSIPPRTAVVGKKLTLTITAYDADGDKLQFSASGLPKGAKLLKKGLVKSGALKGKWAAVLSWKPKADRIGEHTIAFAVRDSFLNPAQDSKEAVFTVTGQP